MRSKGRSRPMSATLTPERKSARDRPASSKERGGLGRESGRSTGELVVRGPRAIGFGSRPVRAVPDPHASRAQPGRAATFRSCRSAQLALASSAAGCRCAIAAVLPPVAPHAIADTPLSLLLSLLRKSTSAAAPIAYCRHLCHARTRMREIWCVGGMWRALGEHVLDRFAAAAPAALVWPQE